MFKTVTNNIVCLALCVELSTLLCPIAKGQGSAEDKNIHIRSILAIHTNPGSITTEVTVLDECYYLPEVDFDNEVDCLGKSQTELYRYGDGLNFENHSCTLRFSYTAKQNLKVRKYNWEGQLILNEIESRRQERTFFETSFEEYRRHSSNSGSSVKTNGDKGKTKEIALGRLKKVFDGFMRAKRLFPCEE